jgi:hypothetical protein
MDLHFQKRKPASGEPRAGRDTKADARRSGSLLRARPLKAPLWKRGFPISDAKSKRDVQRRGWKLAQPFIHNSCYRPRQIAVGTRMHMIAGRGE